MEKQDLEYIKDTLTWLLENNRDENPEHAFNTAYNSLEIIDKAIANLTVDSCSIQLVCSIDQFKFLTKGKAYRMLENREKHFVVLDDFDEKRVLSKEYFKVADKKTL